MNLVRTAAEVVKMLATPDVQSWQVGERGARVLVYGATPRVFPYFSLTFGVHRGL